MGTGPSERGRSCGLWPHSRSAAFRPASSWTPKNRVANARERGGVELRVRRRPGSPAGVDRRPSAHGRRAWRSLIRSRTPSIASTPCWPGRAKTRPTRATTRCCAGSRASRAPSSASASRRRPGALLPERPGADDRRRDPGLPHGRSHRGAAGLARQHRGRRHPHRPERGRALLEPCPVSRRSCS